MSKHPFKIAIGPNAAEKCWDVLIQFGKFETKEAATDHATALVKLIEKHLRGTFERVQ